MNINRIFIKAPQSGVCPANLEVALAYGEIRNFLKEKGNCLIQVDEDNWLDPGPQ